MLLYLHHKELILDYLLETTPSYLSFNIKFKTMPATRAKAVPDKLNTLPPIVIPLIPIAITTEQIIKFFESFKSTS